jgi:putative phosphoesterase
MSKIVAWYGRCHIRQRPSTQQGNIMLIGILSDTHNESELTQRALNILCERGVERLIHCGDLTTPEIVSMFEGWRVDFVYGNMDRQRGALLDAVAALESASIAETQLLYLGGKRFAVIHGHQEEQLDNLISDNYDYVVHGHTHSRRDETRGRTRVLNPGALGGTRREGRSVCVIDLANGSVEFITVA